MLPASAGENVLLVLRRGQVMAPGHLRLWEGPLSIPVDSQLLPQEAVSQGLPLNNRSSLLVLRCHLCDLS